MSLEDSFDRAFNTIFKFTGCIVVLILACFLIAFGTIIYLVLENWG